MVLVTPTSVAVTGTGSSATIGANGSVTFSSAATLSLNGVFSADYDNYIISCFYSQTSESYLRLRFRASGADNSSSLYSNQFILIYNTLASQNRQNSDDKGIIAINRTANKTSSCTNVYGPFLSQPTAWCSTTFDNFQTASLFDCAGTHNNSVSYDGFTAYPDLGSASGAISVYGLVGA